jgi:cytoskeleton protein RodZ
VRQVEALERDDYSAYKGPVFIHGFIRNYAKLLGLDPKPLIRATDSMLNPPQAASPLPSEPEHARRPLPATQMKRRLWPAAAVALIIAIARSLYFGGRRAPDPGRTAASIAARDKNVPSAKTSSAETRSRNESKLDVESAKPPARSSAKTETKAESKSRNETIVRTPTEPNASSSGQTAGRVTVRMIFEQDSWVEIKDRSGNTIFGQLSPAGSRRSVSGEPPLSVVVGNAAGVRLIRDDKNIDLVPHTRVDVARLTLE